MGCGHGATPSPPSPLNPASLAPVSATASRQAPALRNWEGGAKEAEQGRGFTSRETASCCRGRRSGALTGPGLRSRHVRLLCCGLGDGVCLREEEETEEAVETREEEEGEEEEKKEEGDRGSPLHSHTEPPPWSHPSLHAARASLLRGRDIVL